MFLYAYYLLIYVCKKCKEVGSVVLIICLAGLTNCTYKILIVVDYKTQSYLVSNTVLINKSDSNYSWVSHFCDFYSDELLSSCNHNKVFFLNR